LALALSAAVGCGEVTKNNPDAAPPDADPCATGVCECTVATEGTDCGAHEYCNATGTGRTCDCVAGYTDGVTGCVWTGAIQDPGVSATGWTVVSGALLNPTAAGGVDVGEADFVPSSLCSLGGIKQTIEMPTYAKAEPLVLELSYKNQRQNQPPFDQALMGVGWNVGWTPLGAFNDAVFHTVRTCLGEGSYAPSGTVGKGASLTLFIGPFEKPRSCPNTSIANFAIDHAQIVPATAGECSTTFGKGINYDAESTGGWTFATGGTTQGGFVAGIGVGGSKAARSMQVQRCDPAASIAHSINVPMVANPALDMLVGTGGTVTIASASAVGGKYFLPLPAPGASGMIHMCIPKWLAGQVSTISGSAQSNSGNAQCTDITNSNIYADNVQVVDDPSCATTDAGANPGFESTALPLGARNSVDLNGAVLAANVVRNVTGVAHSGSRYLAMEIYSRCYSATLELAPIAPAPVGANGPALEFYSNIPANPNADTQVSTPGATARTLQEGGGWVRNVVCLDPQAIGRPQAVTINHFSTQSGICDMSTWTQQNALIDDLAVTTDPSCPVP
jgi:hypothetical protein